MPAEFISSSVARWLVLPGPADENTSASGLAFARAINSLTFFAGIDGCTDKICGLMASSETGANAASLSYCSVL